jgi:glyoxylase-like metal-dependent hydrolase (beta-lactamase superfamily II)
MTTIRYPWETPPENGEMIEIAEGVHWLRLPLPMKLDHVNIYVLDDGDGWTLIDTGMQSRRVQAMWQAVLDGPLRGKPVKRVVATHHHPDHIGFHGWFVEEFGAEYVSTQVAYLTGRMLTLDTQERYTPGQIDFYRRAGMRSDLLATRQDERPFNFSDMVHPIPIGFTRIEEGDVIEMGGRSWDVRVDHGHAPDHATFWSRDDNLVLCGDQVIPSISSNIGENHHGALMRLRADLKSPKTAGEVMMAVFKRQIGDGEYGLGLVEALAHCNYLWHAGEVTRSLHQDGAYRWVMK